MLVRLPNFHISGKTLPLHRDQSQTSSIPSLVPSKYKAVRNSISKAMYFSTSSWWPKLFLKNFEVSS